MATKISDVSVRVGADIAPLQAGMRKGSRSVDSFGRQAAQAAKRVAAITAAVTAAATVLGGKMVKDTLAAVDAQAKLARQLDGTIDGLRSVQIAGKDAGIEAGVLNGAMERLTTRLGEAQQGTGQAARALRELGLDAERLAAMDVDQRMATLADRMQEMGLSAAQAGNYLRDLGIRNGEIINLMRQGGDAIRNARTELQAFGLSITEIDAAKIERANDAMERIGWASESIRQALTVELAPVIESVANTLSESFRESGREMREGIGGAVDFGVRKFAQLLMGAANIASFVEQNKEMAQFGLVGFLLFGAKGAALGTVLGAIFAEVDEFAQRYGVGISEAEHSARQLADMTQRVGEALRVVRDLEADINERRAQGLRVSQAQLQALESAKDDVTALEFQHAQIRDSMEEQGTLQDAINEALEEEEVKLLSISQLMNSIAESMLRGLEGDDIGIIPDPSQAQSQGQELTEVIEDMLDNQMNAYRGYYASRLHAAEDLAAKEAQIEKDKQTMWDESSKAFGRLSAFMETESKAMFEVGKAAAISQTVIDTYAAAQASYKALAGIPVVGPGLGAAAAAAAVAGGLARVSAISSRQFSSAGGSGGDPGAGAGSAQGSTIQPATVNNSSTANITLNVSGGGDPQHIISALREALADDVILFDRNSAQGRQLT